MPSIEDAQLVRRIRRELDRHPLDFTRTEIESDKGRVRFAGTITFQKDVYRIKVKNVMADILLQLPKIPGIRFVTNDARMIERQDDMEKQETNLHFPHRGPTHGPGARV
jgi:hypothetical protein